jgi:hypothetical protein
MFLPKDSFSIAAASVLVLQATAKFSDFNSVRWLIVEITDNIEVRTATATLATSSNSSSSRHQHTKPTHNQGRGGGGRAPSDSGHGGRGGRVVAIDQ